MTDADRKYLEGGIVENVTPALEHALEVKANEASEKLDIYARAAAKAAMIEVVTEYGALQTAEALRGGAFEELMH